MNKYIKVKRSKLPKTVTGCKCRMHLYTSWPLPFRYVSVWPSPARKSGFVVHCNDGSSGVSIQEISIHCCSFRRARVIAKRFVEGKA